MGFGTTSDSNLNRDQLVSAAYQKIGILADGETLPTSLANTGIQALNMIIRELDAAGKWLWAVSQTPSTVTLVANTWVYTSANGMPTTMLELVKATYRDSQANDWPLQILTTEGYENINNKLDIGDPSSIYLTENITVASKTLFVWPTLATVNTQSEVTGTDALEYLCIRSHTSDSTNKPITGANYLQFWTRGGSTPAVWATGTSYTAPQLLRLWFKRPLFDFDQSTDSPDMPQQWTRLLMYRLAADLADENSLPLDERQLLQAKAKGAYEDIFRTIRPNTTDYHNKSMFF